MSSFTWTSESHALLKEETRKLQFDFEKIAGSIRSHFSPMCDVTASDCRIAYAQEYIAQSAPEEIGSKLEIDDNMTFEEIMDVVDSRNERSEKRKQKIFSRVLASLGTPSETIQLEESYELEKIKSNIAERKKMKQQEQDRKEKYAMEQEESKWIESEREKLRQRYTPGSVDAEGVFPYPTPLPLSSGFDDEAEQKDRALALTTGDVSTETDEAHVPSPEPYSFNTEELFGNEYLDVVLEQIEKELDARAEGKEDSDEEPSELFEVLAFLDKSASERKNVPEMSYTSTSTTTAKSSSHSSSSATSYSSSYNGGPRVTELEEMEGIEEIEGIKNGVESMKVSKNEPQITYEKVYEKAPGKIGGLDGKKDRTPEEDAQLLSDILSYSPLSYVPSSYVPSAIKVRDVLPTPPASASAASAAVVEGKTAGLPAVPSTVASGTNSGDVSTRESNSGKGERVDRGERAERGPNQGDRGGDRGGMGGRESGSRSASSSSSVPSGEGEKEGEEESDDDDDWVSMRASMKSKAGQYLPAVPTATVRSSAGPVLTSSGTAVGGNSKGNSKIPVISESYADYEVVSSAATASLPIVTPSSISPPLTPALTASTTTATMPPSTTLPVTSIPTTIAPVTSIPVSEAIPVEIKVEVVVPEVLKEVAFEVEAKQSGSLMTGRSSSDRKKVAPRVLQPSVLFAAPSTR